MTSELKTQLALPPDQLERRCDPGGFDFDTTADLPSLEEFIGQERAMRAVDFGAGIASHGFNVYALGLPGSGKTTLIRKFLERLAADEPVTDDWCYVNNFEDQHKPQALRLPAGKGVALRDDMAALIENCQQTIPKAFESEEYEQEKDEITGRYQAQQNEEFEALQELIEKRSFALIKVPGGLVLTPAVEGRPLKESELDKLSDEEKEKVQKLRDSLEKNVERGLRRMREIEQAMRQELRELDEATTLRATGHLIDDLKAQYADIEGVEAYLEAVQEDIVKNVDDFKDEKESAMPLPAGMPLPRASSPFSRYEVNVLVDRSDEEGAPVVVETNPTYHNLIGRIEHQAFMGVVATDFTMIKPGALHRANGGYLVLPVRDVLINYYSWEALKRCLKDRCIRTEELGAQLSLLSTVTLEPQTVPLDVKIVLIGNPMLYYLLYRYDEDFQKLFKVKADFATMMDRSPETEHQYALFVRTISDENSLRHFDRGAVARIVDHSSRMVEHQGKLSTRFGEIADLVCEASFWAGRNEHETVTRDDVQRAIEEKVFRSSRVEERIQEVIAERTLRIETEGEEVGQVNGLTVVQLGEYVFGWPSRVTATTFVGKKGVVSIEREAELSGAIHSKGVFILGGYLANRFAQEEPLSLSGHITFEQSYSGVEGDSASSTELYALLSSLSDCPIRQDIAVTGSVDQHGNIQPIGGINQKIEGFFDVCQARGLTGEQGVLIPSANVRHLMLRQDVIEAVQRDQFRIWAVDTIDQGISLLTGQEAGQQDAEGVYPEDSVNRAVADRLADMAQALKPPEDEA